MEILFIWILEYRNIKKQGFNFSSEYNFELLQNGDNNYELTISKNPDYIENFFVFNNVLNVTAIVGQNGAGKSNIIDFIKTSFPEGYSEIESQAIIVYRIKGLEEQKYILIPNNSFKVDVKSDKDFIVSQYPLSSAKETVDIYRQDYTIADYIYYSNIFDLRNEDINMSGFYNISTKASLQKEALDRESNANIIDLYQANEIRRNIQFLLSNQAHLIKKFRLPENLNIIILNGDFNYFKGRKSDLVDADIYELVLDFEERLQLDKDHPKNYFINNLYIAVLLNFLRNDRQYSTIKFVNKVPSLGQKSIKKYVIDFFNQLPQKYFDKRLESDVEISHHVSYSKLSVEFFKFVEIGIEDGLFEISKYNNLMMYYNIENRQTEYLLQFLKLYMQLKRLSDFLDFKWRDLSSGEQSFLTFVSRFYHLKHHEIQHEDISKNLVILIDEGDVYFHPTWQKEFFFDTLSFLSELFKGHMIQIIYTSNTPFITSDLPKSNIIFIENKNGEMIIHPASNMKDTFGGNIHTLFSDSFYVKGALIGRFAETKINEIITYLNSDSVQIRRDYKKTIDIIGEPILKRKMLELWYDKFGTQEEITDLELRLKKLREEE